VAAEDGKEAGGLNTTINTSTDLRKIMTYAEMLQRPFLPPVGGTPTPNRQLDT